MISKGSPQRVFARKSCSKSSLVCCPLLAPPPPQPLFFRPSFHLRDTISPLIIRGQLDVRAIAPPRGPATEDLKGDLVKQMMKKLKKKIGKEEQHQKGRKQTVLRPPQRGTFPSPNHRRTPPLSVNTRRQPSADHLEGRLCVATPAAALRRPPPTTVGPGPEGVWRSGRATIRSYWSRLRSSYLTRRPSGLSLSHASDSM
jgi:hypothetical protein